MTVIPLLLLSGFFASSSSYVPYLKPFEYISTFKYTYQILTEVEFSDLKALSCSNSNSMDLPCDPLKSRFTYNEPMYLSILLIAIVAFFFNFLAFLFQYFRTRVKA